MHRIVGAAIENWRLTIGILVFAIIGGVLALSQIPLDAEPDIPVPLVNVITVLPGVSPEDAERLLIRPLEEELKSIDGIKQMDATAQLNAAVVSIEFEASFDQDQALLDVQEKVDRARAEFPNEAEEPIVEEFNTSELPIFIINLFGQAPERTLQNTAKDLQQRLESIPSVLSADISGEREDVLEAVVDPNLMESLGITFGEISSAVAANNALITAGNLQTETGQFAVKLPGLIEDRDDLAELVIRSDPSGAVIRLSDIAEVRRTYRDADTFARFNGQPSVAIEISKRSGENIIETISEVKAVLASAQAADSWPDGLQTRFTQDKSDYIFDMVGSLSSSIINAVILVFIVCIVALGIRSALFVGFAIPTSFVIALFFLWLQGESLNMMIMFGLILSVGVLVDAAIVIIEYADRKLAEGLPRRDAYRLAGERMFWPIISSTATTLAAFLPLLFWNSTTGKFMAYFPLTMIYVLSASVLMALIFLPTLGALLGPREPEQVNDNALALSGAEGDPSQLSGFTGAYAKLIGKLVHRPLLVIGATLLTCFAIVRLFGASMAGPPPKPVEFFTQTPSDQVYILVRARGNTTPEDKLRIGGQVERLLDQADIEGIQDVYTKAGAIAGGSDPALSGPGNVPVDTVAQINLELEDFKERRSVLTIQSDVRRAISGIPGIFTEVAAVDQGPPIGKDISVELSGQDRALAASAARDVLRWLEDGGVEGVFEIESTLPLPGIEYEIEVDRAEAGRLGLDVSRIGAAVSFVTEGALVGRYRPLDADDEVDIRVRYPSRSRNVSELESLRIQTRAGSVPLSSVVTRKARPKEDSIKRRNQAFVFEVKANTQKGFATNVQIDRIRDHLSGGDVLPSGVGFRFLGQAEENAEAAAFFRIAGAAIIFMMGVILLMQFNSYYHVLLTLMAVVLSVFGVLLGLVFYPYVSMILTLTGVIALAGIVVNNNIVLIDTYQRLSEQGAEPVDAAIRTAAQRLRPVILTTITTVAGLLPLVIGFEANILTGEFDPRGSMTSDIWKPISYAIVTGLSFATLLTLVVTPVLLAAPSVWKGQLAARRSRRAEPKDTDPRFDDEAAPAE